MNLEIIISVSASVLGVLGMALICHRASRRNRELIEFLAKQNEDLDAALTLAKEHFEDGNRKLSDNARRIAWLETRFRKGTSVKSEISETTFASARPSAISGDSLRSNITERRHRVLALASRGQNAEKIASTLGMMPGEVELIINLNRVASI